MNTLKLDTRILAPDGRNHMTEVDEKGQVLGPMKVSSMLANQLFAAQGCDARKATKFFNWSRQLVDSDTLECDEADLEMIVEHVSDCQLQAGFKAQILEALKTSSS